MDIVNNLLAGFGLPEDVYNALTKIIRIIIICLIAYFLIKISNKNSKLIRKIGNKFNRDNTAGLFVSKLTKVSIIIIAAFMILTELDYNVNALVASLGVGGIVIALAAQDVAKNFFGGVTIIADKPFKVGDWIETPTISGNIEDITIRSTRIRAFDGSLVILPNSTLSNENVINWGNMKHRRYKFSIYIKLNTPLEKIDDFISKAYELLENTPSVIDNSVHISFDEIAAHGFEIKFFIDTETVDYRQYLKFKEMINYRVISLLNKEKLSLAYPTQTIHVREEHT